MERVFTFKNDQDEDIKIIYRDPTPEELEEADLVYASKVASLVRRKSGQKLLTRNELDAYLKEIGIWTEKDQEFVANKQNKIDELLDELRKGGISVKEVRSKCIEISELREDIVEAMRKRQIFDDTTVESIAEGEKIDYLIYTATINDNTNERYWESFDEMKNDRRSEVYRRVSRIASMVIYGYDVEFEKNLPENKLLKKYKLVDEDLNLIDPKTGEFVDREGNSLEEAKKDFANKIQSLVGEITPETPFIEEG